MSGEQFTAHTHEFTVPSSGIRVSWRPVGHRMIRRWQLDWEATNPPPVPPVQEVDGMDVENILDPHYRAAMNRWRADAEYAINEQTIAYAVRPIDVSAEMIAAAAAFERAENAKLPRPAKLSDDDLYLYLDAYVMLHEHDWNTLLGMIRARSIVTEEALSDAMKSDMGDLSRP